MNKCSCYISQEYAREHSSITITCEFQLLHFTLVDQVCYNDPPLFIRPFLKLKHMSSVNCLKFTVFHYDREIRSLMAQWLRR